MLTRVGLLVLCLLVPRIVVGGTLVTWGAEGEIGFAAPQAWVDAGRIPPVGTPYQLTMTLDPSSAVPTPSSPPGSNCFMVDVSGSLSLGGHAFTMGGKGFTHATLPGSNCTPGFSQETMFVMGLDPVAVTPWPWLEMSFMELWFRDLVVRDAFPNAPTPEFGGLQIRDQSGAFLLGASHNLHAVEQPTAVPEPGTLTLFGLGLAAVARKIRQRRIAT